MRKLKYKTLQTSFFSSLYCFLSLSCPKTTTYSSSTHRTFTQPKQLHRQTINRPAESSQRPQLCSSPPSSFRMKRTTPLIIFVCNCLLACESQDGRMWRPSAPEELATEYGAGLQWAELGLAYDSSAYVMNCARPRLPWHINLCLIT
jgi:hypothetical protein